MSFTGDYPKPNGDVPENVQKYIAMAQTLSSEARTLSQISEVDEDAALQQMGSVLASNCQKLCIGPSFHFYTTENLSRFQEQVNEMDEQVTETPDNGDEYETVIYKGPNEPYEILKDSNTDKQSDQNIKCQSLNVRLAQLSAEHGGLLSPDFFLKSPGNSSAGSFRGSMSSSENVSSSLSSGISDPGSSGNSKSPFSFPKKENGPNSSNGTTESLEDSAIHAMQRVEILDEPEINEHEWIEWPKKFIQAKGFSLGVKPGTFYKHASRNCYYVKFRHLQNFEVIVTNNNQVSCDLDLYVNGKLSFPLRLPAGASRSIDGPRGAKLAYCAVSPEAISGGEVKPGNKENGHIKAVFTPAKVESGRLRAASEPSQKSMLPEDEDLLDFLKMPTSTKTKRAVTITSGDDGGPVERSLDLSRVSEAAVLQLVNKKKKKNYVAAPEMATDPSKRVTLQLRLIISLDEESDPTEEDACCMEPPPVPSFKKT